jgi:hypothetical protein
LQLLREDPQSALSDEIGTSLPDWLQVVVVEERPDLMYVVLPIDLTGLGRSGVESATGYKFWMGANV